MSKKRRTATNVKTASPTMLISEKMNKSLNQQIGNEMNAAHTYLGMAYSFDSMGLKIFGKRFMQQADEERVHALKIAKFIVDVGAKVHFGAIAAPRDNYPTVRGALEAALQSELTVTRQINDLVALAESEKDYASRSFLEWFVDEQVEEVASVTEMLQLVSLAGEQNVFQVENRIARMMAKPD
jgi:ferritin